AGLVIGDETGDLSARTGNDPDYHTDDRADHQRRALAQQVAYRGEKALRLELIDGRLAAAHRGLQQRVDLRDSKEADQRHDDLDTAGEMIRENEAWMRKDRAVANRADPH